MLAVVPWLIFCVVVMTIALVVGRALDAALAWVYRKVRRG